MASDKKAITVLIVDDDEFVREMATEILQEQLHYEVLTAASGMEAIDMLFKSTVHLILLDVAMPGWDGFKTLSVIRENVLLKELPVIMLTASADRGSVVQAAKYKVEDYICKPFVPEELVSRVSKAVWEHWQEESLDSLTSGLDDLLKSFDRGLDV